MHIHRGTADTAAGRPRAARQQAAQGGLRAWLMSRGRAAAARLLPALMLPALGIFPPAAAAESAALLTLLEGEAMLIIGARAWAAVPGARVPAGTLVETDAGTALLRIEWPDGSVLDLGPATRVMLRPPLAAGATLNAGPGSRGPLFYLLQGWAKQSQAVASAGQVGASFEVPPFKGVLVSHVEGRNTVLFSEEGREAVGGRRGHATMFSLRSGEAAVATPELADGLLQRQARPPAGWLQRMPRAFRDTLPLRAGQFKGLQPTWRARPPLGYAALQPWLVAEEPLRRDFPQRFADLLGERAFRDAVTARLDQHPEWAPLLRPPPVRHARSANRTAASAAPAARPTTATTATTAATTAAAEPALPAAPWRSAVQATEANSNPMTAEPTR